MRAIVLLLWLCTAGALAADAEGFVGSWAGQWKEGVKTGPRGTMTISPTADGKLLLVYSFDTPKRRTLSSPDRVYGQSVGTLAEDGSLQATLSNGARVVCRLRADGVLVGDYDRDDVHYDARFQRVEKP
jgi:hypothetical protein